MVDLVRVAQQIRLDLLAVRACGVLAAAGVPHALIKGPTTARWLYQPPREYRDVDLLVPMSRAQDAAGALEAAGVASPSAGRLGEEASHSWLLITPDNAELDLHVTLPWLTRPSKRQPDLVWDALVDHLVGFDIDGTEVPALDVAGRCLVVALHAIGGDHKTQEDLRRAWATATAEDWAGAEGLAARIGAVGALHGGLSLVTGGVDGGDDVDVPVDVRLRLAGASAGAYQLERLSQARLRDLPTLVWREAFPSPGFMRRADPALPPGRRALAGAYTRRLRRIVGDLPGSLAEWRAARRPNRQHERGEAR